MRLLLDSHAVVWALVDPTQLRQAARIAIDDRSNEIFVSTVTVWELWSKFLQEPLPPMMRLINAGPSGFAECLRTLAARHLDISVDHLIAGAYLPLLHRDPFDRILLAQAQVEKLTLVTRDAWILKYPGVTFIKA